MKPILDLSSLNATERKYATQLDILRNTGIILAYRFEPFKLLLVHGIRGARNEMNYTPDFLVVKPDRFELHEVKGFWREDARLKIKMAAEIFPWFRFVGVQWGKTRWLYEEF